MASSSLNLNQDILWSPNCLNHFLVANSNSIQLYECILNGAEEIKHNDYVSLGNKLLLVRKIKQVKDLETIKCMGWQSSAGEANASFTSPDHLLALAFSTKVVLTSFIQCAPSEDQLGLDKKILLHRNLRSTLFLSWNPWKKNLLAQGLEKNNRQQNREPFLLIWDVCRGDDVPSVANGGSTPTGNDALAGYNVNAPPGGRLSLAGNQSVGNPYFMPNSGWSSWAGSSDRVVTGGAQQIVIDKPLSECGAGMNDTIHGFAWLSKDYFVVGMNGKYLRIYDITDTTKHLKETFHGPIQDIVVEPTSNGRRFATYGDKNVSIWDMDSFDKPIVGFSMIEEIDKIAWCPSKKGLLGVLVRDSDRIRVYDIGNLLHVDTFDEEVDQSLVMRSVKGHFLKKISSFQWHAEYANILLLVDQDGNLDMGQLRDKPVVSWSPDQTIAHVANHQKFMSHSAAGSLSDHRSFLEQDICRYMMERALVGYGTQPLQPVKRISEGLPCYSKLLAGDTKLIDFWKWLERIQVIHWDTANKAKGKLTHLQTNITLSRTNKKTTTTMTSSTASNASNASTAGKVATASEPLSQCPGVMPFLQPSSGNVDNPFLIFNGNTVRVNKAKWQGRGNVCFTLPQYRSEIRQNILRYCLWPTNTNGEQAKSFVEEIYNNNEVDRAAALALFLLQFNQCLTILTNAASELRRQECSKAASRGATSGTMPGVNLGNTNIQTSLHSSDLEKMYLCLVGFDSSTKDHAPSYDGASSDDFIISPVPSQMPPQPYLHNGPAVGGVGGTGGGSGTRHVSSTQSPLSICNSGTPHEQVTASMAEKICDWANSCQDLILRLNSPYLHAMFHFLSATRNLDLAIILDSTGIKLADRVALACIYLTDEELHARLQRYLDECLRNGLLAGVVLTGLNTPQFLQLLQGYLDRTDDIQTVTIVLLHSIQLGNHSLVESPNAYHWVLTYRDLLDRWRLWYHRAEFDIAHHTGMTLLMAGKTFFDNTTMACQVFVSCYYCGHRISQHHNMSSSTVGGSGIGTSISGSSSNSGRLSNAFLSMNSSSASGNVSQLRGSGGFTQQSQPRLPLLNTNISGGGGATPPSSAFTAHMQAGGGKVTICQQCRKALPRCSVCLMHMGTGSGMLFVDGKSQNIGSGDGRMVPNPALSAQLGRQLSHVTNGAEDKRSGQLSATPYPTSSWFTWCQQCRHGGHAAHLMRWFREYPVCPVSGCKCKCIALDKPLLAPARDFDPQKVASCYSLDGDISGEEMNASGSSFGFTGEQEQFRQISTDRLNKLVMNRMSVQ